MNSILPRPRICFQTFYNFDHFWKGDFREIVITVIETRNKLLDIVVNDRLKVSRRTAIKVSPNIERKRLAFSSSVLLTLSPTTSFGIDDVFFGDLALLIIFQKILEEGGCGPNFPKKRDHFHSVYSLIAFLIRPVNLLYSVLPFSYLYVLLFFVLLNQ